MVQTLYGFIAIGLVMLLSLNLLRAATSTEQRMILNEVATQVTGIAVDLMEHLGNKAFDENTDETGIEPSDFPLVTSPSMLTPDNGPDWGGCPSLYDNTCNDIDDFDGMTIERDVEGLAYRAAIEVRYVNETSPNTTSGVSTYAKEVVITVTTPAYRHLLIGGAPLEVRLSRVFAYKRITS